MVDEQPKIAGVTLTHPDRILFAETGLTKRGLAEYYALLGDRFVTHCGHRPVSLLRCTLGIAGECFFQKHIGKGFPDPIHPIAVVEATGKSAEYMSFDDISGAVAAVQMGTIEFHIWGSRDDDLEKPDRLVFDLDPDEGLEFTRVVEAAQAVRRLLDRLGLASIPMVTGGKGVHVICPLRPKSGWQRASTFARALADRMVECDPDRYVATMSKQKRRGRVFVDWLRNERGATAIAPYSVRAKKGAPVAVPLDWNELAGIDRANGFGVRAAAARLSRPCPLLSLSAKQTIGPDAVRRLKTLDPSE